MKLIVAGASGFVASEVVRQALQRPHITKVIGLSRTAITSPGGVDGSKLKSVVVNDYDDYPEDVKKEFEGADACIWTVAILPANARADPEAAKRVCLTLAVQSLRTMYAAGPAKPFRFVYMSGVAAERDQSKRPWVMGQYALMRGEAENQILAFASEHKDEVQACVAKPGLIIGPGHPIRNMLATAIEWAKPKSTITVETIAAAMLDQVINGFEKEPLQTEDLVRIGQRALEAK